jgi:hydroxyacylglutathione hydrolase
MHIQTIPMCKQASGNPIRWLLDQSIDNVVGTGKSNNYAYLVTDEPTKQSVIIDPAHPEEYVVLICHQLSLDDY